MVSARGIPEASTVFTAAGKNHPRHLLRPFDQSKRPGEAIGHEVCNNSGVDETQHQPAPGIDPADFATVVTGGFLFDEVKVALDEIRPILQDDGGDAALIEIEDDSIAIIEFFGKCVGCPMSEMTIRYGIEAHLRMRVPQIHAVDVVPDKSKPVREFTDVLERATFKPLA